VLFLSHWALFKHAERNPTKASTTTDIRGLGLEAKLDAIKRNITALKDALMDLMNMGERGS
jgi:hypothetical protein